MGGVSSKINNALDGAIATVNPQGQAMKNATNYTRHVSNEIAQGGGAKKRKAAKKPVKKSAKKKTTSKKK